MGIIDIMGFLGTGTYLGFLRGGGGLMGIMNIMGFFSTGTYLGFLRGGGGLMGIMNIMGFSGTGTYLGFLEGVLRVSIQMNHYDAFRLDEESHQAVKR